MKIDLTDPAVADLNADWLKTLPGAEQDQRAGELAIMSAIDTHLKGGFKELLSTRLKHLVGHHNQKKHGYRGAAAEQQQAGRAHPTAPDAATLPKPGDPHPPMTAAQDLDIEVVKRARYDWEAGDHARAPIEGDNRARFVDSALQHMRDIFGSGEVWTYANYREPLADPHPDSTQTRNLLGSVGEDADLRAFVKKGIAADLAQRSGLPEAGIANRIKKWASTAGDSDEYALELQSSASLAFNVPLSKYHQAAMEKARYKPGRSRAESADNVKYWEAAYQSTQEHLASLGYKPDDTITLYRGMNYVGKKGKMTGPARYEGNSVESWTMDVGEARLFADREAGGVIMSASISIRNIVSTFLTGPGCFNEQEFLVLGSLPGQEVYIHDISIRSPSRPAPGSE